MTQKELSYVEDAIEHESTILDGLNEATNLLSDENLKEFLEQEINSHEETKQKLMSLLEGEANA